MTFNEKYKDNALLIKTFNFALNIIDYTTELQDQKKFVIANQLLKSGTSIGANSKESQNAESKADFIHKLKIASKGCVQFSHAESDAHHALSTRCSVVITHVNRTHLLSLGALTCPPATR